MTKNIEDLHALAKAMRANGQGLIAHIIEAGLDDAVGQVLAAGQQAFAISQKEADVIRQAITDRLLRADGTSPEFDVLVKLRNRITTLDWSAPMSEAS